MILQHPRSVPHLVDPVTFQTVDAAKSAARKEQAYEVAYLLGLYTGINLRTCSPLDRARLLDIGLRAVDAAQKATAL
jgi:hypothetical protein